MAKEPKQFNALPKHIAIIMDGNRRWAKNRGKSPEFGHREGYKRFIEIGEVCRKMGIKTLTVYAFSTENWKRKKEEVDCLIDLLRTAIKRETKRVNKENIRIRILGRKEDLPDDLRETIKKSEQDTENNTSGNLNIALSYGGRAEIVNTIKSIIKSKIKPEEITEKLIQNNLYTKGQDDPDLIIRCGGEKRLSNFLLWQSAYAELYFSDILWPDFNEGELYKALNYFSNVKRNFGE